LLRKVLFDKANAAERGVFDGCTPESTMTDLSHLDSAIEGAMARLDAAGDLKALSAIDQTVLLVHGAQGVIDDGVLQYFFESDWPDRPPYSMFVDAYRRIGADVAASHLERAVAMLALPDPHLSEGRRQSRLESLTNDGGWCQIDRK